MAGYKLQDNKTVLAMSQIQITGNVIPVSWYQYVCHHKGEVYKHTSDGESLVYKSDKPYPIAILLLAEIVYWYRPIEIRDEATGEFIEYRKKFKSDKLQRSYDSFAKQFGLTKTQVKLALKFLQNKVGVIDLEFRTITIEDDIKLGNVLFIGLNIDRLAEISTPLSRNSYIGVHEFLHTNTKNTTENTNTIAKNKKRSSRVRTKSKPKRPKSQRIKNLELLENLFANLRGVAPPKWDTSAHAKASMKKWREPMMKILEELSNNDMDAASSLINATIRRMRRDNLTFSTPVQIVKTAESIAADAKNNIDDEYTIL